VLRIPDSEKLGFFDMIITDKKKNDVQKPLLSPE